jgi:cell division protein FtsB
MLKDKLPKVELEKIREYRQIVRQWTDQLSDIRVIGLLVFLGITLLITWSGVKAIDTNYGLQKQVATLEQQNDIQKLTNSNLALQNDYYNTNQYLELAARQSFGLGAPGETELLIPTSVALADTTTLTNPEQQQAAKAVNKQPAYQRNFEAWMDFLLHRENS